MNRQTVFTTIRRKGVPALSVVLAAVALALLALGGYRQRREKEADGRYHHLYRAHSQVCSQVTAEQLFIKVR
ncbi:MAG: hypothetical protein IBX68_02970 [Dehalococcoidia bacterium]|nr:hypothetical protein [Dehalococcoidia bacterium]